MNWAPNFGEEEPNIEGAVYQALGAASLCWEDMSATGIFQSDEATQIAQGLLRFIAYREASTRAELEGVQAGVRRLKELRDEARAEVAALRRLIPIVYGIGRDDEAAALPMRQFDMSALTEEVGR